MEFFRVGLGRYPTFFQKLIFLVVFFVFSIVVLVFTFFIWFLVEYKAFLLHCYSVERSKMGVTALLFFIAHMNFF